MKSCNHKSISVQTLIQNYFLERLIQQRGVTPRTIETYRDTFRIYITYLQEKNNTPVDKITINDFEQNKVLNFLEYLENDRYNKPVTLNNRLSVIHSFMKYVAEQAPEYSDIAKRTIMIPLKKHEIKTFDYISKKRISSVA